MKKLWTILAMVVIGTATSLSVYAFISSQKSNNISDDAKVKNEIIKSDNLKAEISNYLNKYVEDNGAFSSRQDAINALNEAQATNKLDVEGIKRFDASDVTGINEASVKIQNIALQDGYEWSAETPTPSFDLPIKMDIESNLQLAINEASTKSYITEEDAKIGLKEAVEAVDGVQKAEVNLKSNPSESRAAGNVSLDIVPEYISGVTTEAKTFNASTNLKINLNATLQSEIDAIKNKTYATPAKAEEEIKIIFNSIDGVQVTSFSWVSVPLPGQTTSLKGYFNIEFKDSGSYYIDPVDAEGQVIKWTGSVNLFSNSNLGIEQAETKIKQAYYEPIANDQAKQESAASKIIAEYKEVEGISDAKITWIDPLAGKYRVEFEYEDEHIGYANRNSYINIKPDISQNVEEILNQGINDQWFDTADETKTKLTEQILQISILPPNQQTATPLVPVQDVDFDFASTDVENVYSYKVNLTVDRDHFQQTPEFTGTFKVKTDIQNEINATILSMQGDEYTNYDQAINAIVDNLNKVSGVGNLTKDNVVRNLYSSNEFIVTMNYDKTHYAQAEYTIALNINMPSSFDKINEITLDYTNFYGDSNPSVTQQITGKGLDLTKVEFKRTNATSNLNVLWNSDKTALVIQATSNLEGSVEEDITLYLSNDPNVSIKFKVVVKGAPKIEFIGTSPSLTPPSISVRTGRAFEFKFKVNYFTGNVENINVGNNSTMDAFVSLEDLDNKIYKIRITTKTSDPSSFNIYADGVKITSSPINFTKIDNPSFASQPSVSSQTNSSYNNLKVGDKIVYKFKINNYDSTDLVYAELYGSAFWEGKEGDTIKTGSYDDGKIKVSLTNVGSEFTLTVKATGKNSKTFFVWGSQYAMLKVQNKLDGSEKIIDSGWEQQFTVKKS